MPIDQKNRIFTDFLNNSRFEIYHHGYRELDSAWRGGENRPPYNRLYCITGGSGTVKTSRAVIKLYPGNSYLFPINQPVDFSTETTLQKFFMHFSLQVFSLTDIFEICEPHIFSVKTGRRIKKIMKFSGASCRDMLQSESTLLELVSEFIPESCIFPGMQKKKRKFEPALKLIEKMPMGSLKLALLSRECGMSAVYFSAEFKKTFDINVKDYIIKKIMQKAKCRLSWGAESVKDTARSLGFNDEYYFSRFFKKHTGYTPSFYRNHTVQVF
ncbi:MAG: hypothetical protein A2096_01630 [Spirochaetes bacterium GWF1_41_5]|nr:MAG: hypothetical protein A2096_01630 [Spirochaetes bacterium GWF1_41_5]HBE03624.1 hypothetical protein [Spirochaetia bacterium]